MLSFYKQQSYFSQIVSKKAKTRMNSNIILGFSFMPFGFSLSNEYYTYLIKK